MNQLKDIVGAMNRGPRYKTLASYTMDGSRKWIILRSKSFLYQQLQDAATGRENFTELGGYSDSDSVFGGRF